MRRSVLVVAILLLLCACGSQRASDPPSGTTTAAGDAPYGIGAVAFPTDPDHVRGMLSRLPARLDGIPAAALEEQNGSTSFQRRYDDGADYGNYPEVYVSRNAAGETPAQSLVALWMWTGCAHRCGDWRSSVSLQPLAHATGPDSVQFTEVAGIPPSSSELLWFGFTGSYDVENGRTMPAQEQPHSLVWAVGDWTYVVTARSDDQLAALTAALVAAVPGPAVTAAPRPSGATDMPTDTTDLPTEAVLADCSAADQAELARILRLVPWRTSTVDAAADTGAGCAWTGEATASYATVHAALRALLVKAGYGEDVQEYSEAEDMKVMGTNRDGRVLVLAAISGGPGSATTSLDVSLGSG